MLKTSIRTMNYLRLTRKRIVMAEDDKELICLNRIKKHVFQNTGCLESDKANASVLHSSVFGFTEEAWQYICDILRLAKRNNRRSEFPDFKCGSTVLEHFEITATKETDRKGSVFRREHEQFLNEVDKLFDEAKSSVDPKAIYKEFKYPEQSHCLLLKSLKRNLDNHIESLKKYVASNEIDSCIIIIEHCEKGISMFENVFYEVGAERVFGDLRNHQQYSNYRLSRDRNALDLLYEHVSIVDIIIFVGAEYIEIIKVDEIPNMLKLMPWPFIVAAPLTKEYRALDPVLQIVEESEEQVDCAQDDSSD